MNVANESELGLSPLDEPLMTWVTLEGMSSYPLPKPHLRIAELLR